MDSLKLCTKCGENKPIKLFNFRSKSKGTLNPWCKSCCADYRKAYTASTSVPRKKYARTRSLTTILKDVWRKMQKRCFDPKNKDFSHYGGRGISVYEDWRNFDNFFRDMSPTYSEGLSIDRIDVNGDYCKENCRWATPSQQARNQRRSLIIKIGDETKHIKEWCLDFGADYEQARALHKRGVRGEQLFIKPKSPTLITEQVILIIVENRFENPTLIKERLLESGFNISRKYISQLISDWKNGRGKNKLFLKLAGEYPVLEECEACQ